MNLLLQGQGVMGEGIDREFGLDTSTLLYLKWIIGKDLLCSMFCGSLDGRGVWGRIYTCILAESLCCAPSTITTLSAIQNKN